MTLSKLLNKCIIFLFFPRTSKNIGPILGMGDIMLMMGMGHWLWKFFFVRLMVMVAMDVPLWAGDGGNDDDDGV